jgi:hypothetical protein
MTPTKPRKLPRYQAELWIGQELIAVRPVETDRDGTIRITNLPMTASLRLVLKRRPKG